MFVFSGGMYHSSLIKKNVVTALIPFLPMDISHVKSCIRADLKNKKNHLLITEKVVNAIAEYLHFGPLNNPVFSIAGCKRVSEKVDLYLEMNSEL